MLCQLPQGLLQAAAVQPGHTGTQCLRLHTLIESIGAEQKALFPPLFSLLKKDCHVLPVAHGLGEPPPAGLVLSQLPQCSLLPQIDAAVPHMGQTVPLPPQQQTGQGAGRLRLLLLGLGTNGQVHGLHIVPQPRPQLLCVLQIFQPVAQHLDCPLGGQGPVRQTAHPVAHRRQTDLCPRHCAGFQQQTVHIHCSAVGQADAVIDAGHSPTPLLSRSASRPAAFAAGG